MPLYALALVTPEGHRYYIECSGDSWSVVTSARDSTKFSHVADAVLAAQALPDFPFDADEPLAPGPGRVVRVAPGHEYETD